MFDRICCAFVSLCIYFPDYDIVQVETCRKDISDKWLFITDSANCWLKYCIQMFFFLWRCDATRVMASSFLRFLDHTQWRTTVGRTPLDEWSARRRDLYLKTHNTHNRQTSMLPVGFEPTTSAGKRPQTFAIDRTATGTGTVYSLNYHLSLKFLLDTEIILMPLLRGSLQRLYS